MDLKIIKEIENALFGRKEIFGVITSGTSPSRLETLKVLSKKFNAPENHIKIKGIAGRFGSKEFNLEANIYSSEEEKNKTELKKKKDDKVAAPTEEAKPVEAPKEVSE